jgi:hypothetical protein
VTSPDLLADITPAEAAILRVRMEQWVAEQQQARDPAELGALEWARTNATIVLPTEGRQRFEPYNYQAALLADDHPRRLILKARQTGISNVVAIEALHKAITRPDSTELFVSRSQDAAGNLIRYCQHTLNGLRKPPTLVKENATEIGFANGSRIVSLSASPKTGRSFAATDVYLDEYAFILYDQLVYESMMGTISTGGRMTILSTANGRANMFYRLWQGLEGGAWSRHTIHWSDCPRFDAAWEQRTRAGMTRQSFAQEYDLDFATSGDAVFDAADLEGCKVGHEPNGPFEDFVTAWDIGRRRDHTVGITLGRIGDVWHEVEYARCQDPYPTIGGMIDTRKRRYPGIHAVESNGVGDPLIEFLDEDVERFTTTAKSKVQAIQALQLLIQQGRFKHQNEQLDRELALYQWDDRALVTDSVLASAIAAYQVVDSGTTEFY